MPTNFSNDLTFSSNNPQTVTNEGEVSHNSASAANRRQIRVLYAIKFLISISSGLNFISLYPIFKEGTNLGFEEFSTCLDSRKSSYTIIQAISNIGFGLVSDKFGRKPALNACLLGSSLCIGLFGFTKNVTTFSLIYTLNGAFNCSSDVIRLMTMELSDKYFRPYALTHLYYVELIGESVGGILGGYNAFQYFTESEFNGNGIPTSAPINLILCLISVGINVTTYMLSKYYLNETLYENRASLNMANIKCESHENLDKLPKTEQYTLFGLRLSKNSKLILIGSLLAALTHNWFLNTKFNWSGMTEAGDSLNLVMENVYLTPLLFITMIGALKMYPYAIKKLGALKVYRFLFPVTPIIFISYSILTRLAKIRHNHNTFIPLKILDSTKIGLYLLRNSSTNLLLSESSEATKTLGTLYGISNALDKIADLTAKPIFSAIQAISSYNIFPSLTTYKNLNWGLLTTLSLTGYCISTKIKNIC